MVSVFLYFRVVSVLMFFKEFGKVSTSLAKAEESTGTIKAVYHVTAFEVVLGIFWEKVLSLQLPY